MIDWKIFPQSRELIGIIERSGWGLYDITTLKEKRHIWEHPVRKWRAIDKLPRIGELELGHMYMMLPHPNGSEPLSQAYTTTYGVGPAMNVVHPVDTRFFRYAETYHEGPAFFNRMALDPEGLVLTSVKREDFPYADFLVLKYETALETFQRDFKIVTMEECRFWLSQLGARIRRSKMN
jgi:hypothetical protein